MASLLLFWILFSHTTYVRGYAKNIPWPDRLYTYRSGYWDDDKSYVSCPPSSTLISCGLQSGDHYSDGSYVENGQCVAQNGAFFNDILAIALCLDGDYSCTYPIGSKSGNNDNDASTVGCSSPDQIMISCTAQSSWSAIDGAYVGAPFQSTPIDSNTVCTAHTDGTGGDGQGVSAHGICCKYNDNDGYQLDCETKWGNPSDPEAEAHQGWSTVDCDDGYTALSCMGYSTFKNSLSAYYRWGTGSCGAKSYSSDPVQAIATCCRLYKDPTPSPTENPTAPTNAPTQTPTSSPTPTPTADPTPAPTYHPTRSPTCSVYGHCASVSMHCDNHLTVEYAENGVDFTQIAYADDWEIETRVFLQDINIKSVLKFYCEDVNNIGGFIASVDYKDMIYSTTSPISVGGFEVVESSDGILAPLTYHRPFDIDTGNMGHNAYWIWNGGRNNIMIFEFRFDNMITAHPTPDPTPSPTYNPTKAPTTPSPSKPGTITCGEQDIGDYNNMALDITVRMLFPGDLTFDASQSDFTITSISAVFGAIPVGSDSDFDGVLTLYDLTFVGDYIFTLRADDGVSGQYDIRIICESDNPTSSPTTDPTKDPTSDPTTDPTVKPTYDPTIDPTMDPSVDPTIPPTTNTPTDAPTNAPTVAPSAGPTRSPHMLLVVRPRTRPPTTAPTTPPIAATYNDDNEGSDDVMSTFVSDTNDGEGLRGKDKGKSGVLGALVIGLGVAIAIVIGCIVYYCVVRAKRNKQRWKQVPPATQTEPPIPVGVLAPDTNGNGETERGPGTEGTTAPGEQTNVELGELISGDNNDVDQKQMVVTDNTDTESESDGLYIDTHLTQTAGGPDHMTKTDHTDNTDTGSDSDGLYGDPHVSQTGGAPHLMTNRTEGPQASLVLPALPQEAPNTPSVSDSEGDEAVVLTTPCV